MLTLHLPYPPSVNHYWRHVVRGARAQVYVSEAGSAYRTAVGKIVAKARANGLLHAEPLDGRLAVAVAAYVPDKRDRDLDNVFKALLDALTHSGVWLDDSQIDRLAIERASVVKGGAVVVLVESLRAVRKAA